MFDIEEVEINKFVKENGEQFAYHRLHAWLIFYDDVSEFEQYLQSKDYL